MRNYITVLFLLMLAGCTHYDEVFLGLYDGKSNCCMLDYFRSHPGWDSLVVAIEHAGVENVFDGTDPDFQEITFFGMTNYSIKHTLKNTLDKNWERKYMSVRDIPRDLCKVMLLSHVIKGKFCQQDFDYEVKGKLEGGTIVKTLTGIDLRVYRIKSPDNNVPDAGPEYLGIHAIESGTIALVESANIETANGYVHSLRSEYEWTEL